MKRLKEPSTWAGLGILFQAIKVVVPPQYHIIVDGATGAAGWLAVQLRERAQVA